MRLPDYKSKSEVEEMKKMRKSIMALILVLLLGMLTACGGNDNKTATSKKDSTESDKRTEDTTTEDVSKKEASDGSTMDMTGVTTADKIEGFDQTAMPEEGDTIATISVEGYGDITVRFFEEIAPYGVKNFITHAKEGYYEGVSFHRVIKDFMIQGGDPEGTGMGGDSIWKTPFYNEISEQAYVIRGSLCYANSGVDPSNGSQFFITQMAKVTEEDFKTYESQGYTFTEEQKKIYMEHGGCPWLQGGYTVFGQVIEGMDVVDKIAEVDVDESDKPTENVTISKVTVSEYKAK